MQENGIRQSIKKIISKSLLKEQEESDILEKKLEISQTERILSSWVKNETTNNIVEIKYEGQFSPLMFSDPDLIKGKVHVYFNFKNFNCVLVARFEIEKDKPESNLVVLEDFFADSEKDNFKIEGFDEFDKLQGNIAGQATRHAEVLIQQKVSIDLG